MQHDANEQPADGASRPRGNVYAGAIAWRRTAAAAAVAALALAFDVPLPLALVLAICTPLAMSLERRALTAAAVPVDAHSASDQREAERSGAVLEALSEGVVVVDADGRIVLANPGARAAMRRPARDPEGCLLWEALSPALGQRAREAWRALRERPAGPSAPDATGPRHSRVSGIACGERRYDLTAVPVASARTGEDFGTALLIVDCTRTYELQRVKDRFLSSVSHELRTPLTNICAYSEILSLMMPGESIEWPEFVRVIHEEGVQLSGLVDAMFDYLQLESGEAQFAYGSVDGVAAVRAAVAAAREKSQQGEVTVEVCLGDDVPSLLADAARVRQVVDQLVDNAIKFSPVGGRVLIRVTRREGDWQLRVEDEGPGGAQRRTPGDLREVQSAA